jgi:hypothetical protein
LRLRIRELLKRDGLTPDELVERSGRRISRATAYRLVRLDGRLDMFNSRLCEVLAAVFDLKHPGELFEFEERRGKR